MKTVLVSDIHSRTDRIRSLEPHLREADLVLLLGDLTHFGHADEAAAVLESFCDISPHILAVAGNCDHPDVERFLADRGVSLDGRCLSKDGRYFVGIGGSLPAPGGTPNEYTDRQIGGKLSELGRLVPRDADWIMVAHQPPLDTAVDVVTGGFHVGSSAVRSFIEKHGPLACFSGHIHEARGTDAIGTTLLVNPGSFREGWFATVDLGCTPLSAALHRLS